MIGALGCSLDREPVRPTPDAEATPATRAVAAPAARAASLDDLPVSPPEPTRPEPLARWDTAYERPEPVQHAITQTVRAWTGADLPLPPECLADLTDARIEVWTDGADMCWKDNDRGCFFRTPTSQRPVIQLQRDEPLADTLPHEALHLLESCAGLWEAEHAGPGFRAESHAVWLAKRRLGRQSMAEVVSAGEERRNP